MYIITLVDNQTKYVDSKDLRSTIRLEKVKGYKKVIV